MVYQCYELARLLTPKEWKDFLHLARHRQGLRSPDIVLMLNALESAHPDFATDDADLWTRAFPDKAYNEPRLRLLRSHLLTLLEDFIVDRELQQDPTRRLLLLIRGLAARGGIHRAQKTVTKVLSGLNRPLMQVDDLEFELDLALSELDILILGHSITLDYDWQALYRKQSILNSVKTLRLLAATIGVGGTFTSRQDWLDEVIDRSLASCTSEQLVKEPILYLYHLLVGIMSHRKPTEYLPELLTVFQQHRQQMTQIESFNIYGFIINMQLHEIRMKKPGSLESAYQTYKLMHEQGLLFGHGAATDGAIKNIVNFGMRLGDNTWIHTFLEEAKDRLDSEERENTLHYCQAVIGFAERNYFIAKRHLGQLTFEMPTIRLFHDNLLMRIYFETRDADAFFVVFSTLTRHLYRKEAIPKASKTGTIHLAKAIDILFHLVASDDLLTAIPLAKERIAKLSPILHLDWIEAKLAELQSGGNMQPAHDSGPVRN